MMKRIARKAGALRLPNRSGPSSAEGSQLLEFALVVPLLLVFVIGIIDFSGAYNLKQKLNNAAREGARYAATQSSNISDIKTTAAAQAVGNVVENYMENAGLTNPKCSFAAPSSPTLVYTYTSSKAGCSLVVDRGYIVTNGTGSIISTHVTVSYPYSWSFNKIIRLFVPGSSLSLPTTISSDAVMQN